MRTLTVAVDMNKITEYKTEEVPDVIDKIVEPYHLKWCFNNIYVVEPGFDEDLAIYNAVKALKAATWTNGTLVFWVGYAVEELALDKIDTSNMSEPNPEKMNYYRKYIESNESVSECLKRLKPIVIDNNKRIVDGYITYLLMREHEIKKVKCFIAREGCIMKKYISGIHLPESKKGSRKEYRWKCSIEEPVVPGDIVVANTRYGEKMVKVTRVNVATAGYVKTLKAVKRKVGEEDVERIRNLLKQMTEQVFEEIKEIS